MSSVFFISFPNIHPESFRFNFELLYISINLFISVSIACGVSPWLFLSLIDLIIVATSLGNTGALSISTLSSGVCAGAAAATGVAAGAFSGAASGIGTAGVGVGAGAGAGAGAATGVGTSAFDEIVGLLSSHGFNG